MKLNSMEMNDSHEVTVLDMRMTDGDFIVLTVESETLEGNTLWLKGKYGLQNGARQLMKLVNSSDTEDYIGETFTVLKMESEKSMSGYRYHWTI